MTCLFRLATLAKMTYTFTNLNPPHPMPLQKSPSKKAFVENLKAELKSGRDKKQALAIAYSVQRQSKREKYRGK